MDALDAYILRDLGMEPFVGWSRRPRGLKASDIARGLGKNVRLVQDRIARMEKDGVIRGYGVFPNPRHCGLALTTFHVHANEVIDEENLARLNAVDGFVSVVPYLGSGLCLTLSHATPSERDRRLRLVNQLLGTDRPAAPHYEHDLPDVRRSLTALDWRIIASLLADARKPLPEVADALGVTTKTVRTRLTRMREEGSIDEVAHLDFGRMTGILPFEIAVWYDEGPADIEASLLARLHDRYLAHFRPPPGGYCSLLLRVFADTPAQMQSLVRSVIDIEGVARAEPLTAAGAHFNHTWLEELLATRIHLASADLP